MMNTFKWNVRFSADSKPAARLSEKEAIIMGKHIIVGVHITNRLRDAGKVQQVFSEYGCNIKTRIGLHDVQEGYCSPSGLVILDIIGDPSAFSELKSKLAVIEGLEIKEMVFSDHG
jgi:hypothetical protein